MPLTARDVAEIVRLLEESDFEELRIEHDGLKLTLRRGANPKHEGGESAGGRAASPAPTPAVVPASVDGEPRGEFPPATDGSVINVIAPFVGIFYRAPKPGAPPYVEVGSPVEKDTIVGIIEVMKLMNTVRAEAEGTVIEILAQDGAVVEYGQLLLRIARGAQSG